MQTHNGFKLGWRRDFADPRDYTLKHPDVQDFKVASTLFGDSDGSTPPSAYDISHQFACPAVKNQGDLSSCTANAGTMQLEVYACVAGYEDIPLSRKFLYKATRNLLSETGDSGAFLRTTMQAMATFGVPPESYYPYDGDPDRVNEEPSAFLYSMAQSDRALTYYRLDPTGADPEKVINSMKVNLATNRALIGGFTVYSNMDNSGDIAMPGVFSAVRGGHAICLVGYDDTYRIGSSTGAFKLYNSGGSAWGHSGFAYLPFDYVRKGLASDIWALMSASWLKLDVFQ